MTELPDEIWWFIISHLKPHWILRTAYSVSKTWAASITGYMRHYAHSWKRLPLNAFLMTRIPKLLSLQLGQSMAMSGSHYIKDTDLIPLASLKTLAIHFIPSVSWLTERSLLCMTCLTTLELNWDYHLPERSQATLTKLDISSNRNLMDASLCQFTALRELVLTGCRCVTHDSIKMLTNLSSLTVNSSQNIKVEELHGLPLLTKLSTHNLQRNLNVASLTTLKCLGTEECESEGLIYLTRLETLCLYRQHCILTKSLLRSLTRLCDLQVRALSIEETVIEQDMKNLTRLVVSYQSITCTLALETNRCMRDLLMKGI